MIRIIIADSDPNGHGANIKAAISLGYGSDISSQISILPTWSEAIAYVQAHPEVIALIRSTTNVQDYVAAAQTVYPRVQTFFPLGSNSFIRLYIFAQSEPPVIITVGAGDFCDPDADRNNTGYGNGLEFWDHDFIIDDGGDQSSFSNGIIAGKMLKIRDTLNCSWWEARYRARMTTPKSEPNRQTSPWDLYNGYGRIDVEAALAYTGSIPWDEYDPALGTIGNLAAVRNGNIVDITLDAVHNASGYQIIRNGETIYSGLTYQDTISNGLYEYRYRAVKGEEATDLSEVVTIDYRLGDIGALAVHRVGNQVYLTMAEVANALEYAIYRDDIEIYHGSELTFVDRILPGVYSYEYMAIGDPDKTTYSALVTVEWTYGGAMKEFKTALKEVLVAAQATLLTSVKRIEKTGSFTPSKEDFDLIYFQEPVDKYLAGDHICRAIESTVNVYCVVLSDLNNREHHEERVEDLAWKVIDVILANPTLICATYPAGLCNARAFTKIGNIIHTQGTLTKNQMPVEIATFSVTGRYEIRN